MLVMLDPFAAPRLAAWLRGWGVEMADDVVIAGPVIITGTEACLSLVVNPVGYLGGVVSNPFNTLEVGGSVNNAGTISDGAYNFFLHVGGDLHTEGTWASHETMITGRSALPQPLSAGSDVQP